MKEPCGCCTGVEVVTPAPEANRPGLPALSYRAGTHASFFESMIARLSTLYLDVTPIDGQGEALRIRPLIALTTRETDDPSIALLDAWATVADVLTFYQERIANEGYLRTATERRSVLELARLVGYRLRPAVSASVYLAFTVADGFQGELPPGTRAQSVPIGSGDKPQFFETGDNLTVRDVWNNLKPRLTRPQTITHKKNPGTDADTRDTIYFKGIATNLSAGDKLLFVLGDRQGYQVLRNVESVETQADQDRTAVTLEVKPLAVSGATAGAASRALIPYVEEAGTIFAGNDLAADAATEIQQLLANIGEVKTAADAAGMVTAFLAEVENWQGIAARRRFTRVKAWLGDLHDTLEQLAPALLNTTPSSGEGGGLEGTVSNAQPIKLLQSGLSSSPLENLASIMAPLARALSPQPANEWRLARNVRQIFAPQADVSPKILSAFRARVSKKAYSAWSGVETPMSQVKVYAMRVKASLFGSTVQQKLTLSTSTSNTGTTTSITSAKDWPVSEAADSVYLDAGYEKIRHGSWIVVETTTTNITAAKTIYARAKSPQVMSRGAYGMSGKATKIGLVKPENPADSVDWLTGTPSTSDGTPPNDDFKAIRETLVYAQPEELELAEEPLDNDIEGDKIELARLYDGLEAGRWIIVSGTRTDIPNTSGVTASELVMVSGVTQGTRALLCEKFPFEFIPFSEWAYTTDANQFGDRLVVGYMTKAHLEAVQKEMLKFGKQSFSVSSSASGKRVDLTLNRQFCDQVQLAPGVYANAYLPSLKELEGDFTDFAGLLVDPKTNLPYEDGHIPLDLGDSTPDDALFVYAWRISMQDVHTVLALANKLTYKYDPMTVTIYGNVVKATHGQTIGEVLGNGDASQPLQRFSLHQMPLTYLSAPTPAGAESTLKVTVNEVEWHEAGNMAGLGPNDRNFVTQTDDADHVTTIFGNGEHGMRTPTGAANVKAVYRYGCGKVGNVQALQISQLASQPLGAKSVINPLPASGGADRDTLDDARRNTPLAVTALDRLVSVRDYADFARTYAGIGKAAAARLSDGQTMLVHVTVAGKDDVPIDINSDLYRNLVQALEQFGDPYQPLRVAVRRLKLLVIHAGVKVLPDYQWESVGAAVKAALLDFYSFDRRDLGQTAFLSEAVGVMQGVTGVQYVDVRVFDSIAENVTAAQLAGLAGTLEPKEYVEAELARRDPAATDPTKSILPAELVMLTPDVADTLTLTEITV